MKNEVHISKVLFQAISDVAENAASILQQDIDNERKISILRNKVFQMKNMIRECMAFAKLKYPEEFGGAPLKLDEIISERNNLEKSMSELSAKLVTAIPEEGLKLLTDQVKIQKRLASLKRLEGRLKDEISVSDLDEKVNDSKPALN